MARRENELFIGADKLNIEGRAIKHPGLIKLYATVNINKISATPIECIGLDLETNHITAELKLLGFYNGERYNHYYKPNEIVIPNDNFNWIGNLFNIVRYADRQDRALVYWNRLDPFVIFKQFLYHIEPEERVKALLKFSKISGEWDRENEEWEIPPVVSVKVGQYHFGIKNVIRSSIQFFFNKEGNKPRTIWAYDVAQLFFNGLEKEATKYLDYYSKVDKSAHLVDWERFENDEDFKTLVLHSNELDSRAVYDLSYVIQRQFKDAFGYYPRTLISQGSLARSAIVAVLCNLLDLDITQEDIDPVKLKLLTDDIKSIAFISYYDEWYEKYGDFALKDMYSLFMEAYSGGQIEAYMYGYSPKGYIADLTQAYPGIIQKLWDLRNAKITWGEGEPPTIDYSYCYIRGEVNIPLDVDYHPLTIKHPLKHETNIRAVGNYRASYMKHERDYLIKLGATFKNEFWYNIETEGKLSPLAVVTKELVALREKLRPEGKDYTPKVTSASVYGLTYEAVDTYQMELEDIVRAGYRSGEFFNPIYASVITSEVRLQVSEACQEIKDNGGKPILVMTDAVVWEGSKEMLSMDKWRNPKIVGYFEEPKEITDIVCLGSGRYGYKDGDGYQQAKKRGLNVVDFHDPDGIVFDEFNWLNALEIMKKTNSEKILITVRVLISVGIIAHNGFITQMIDDEEVQTPITWEDLGKVVEVVRKVDAIVGKNKRIYDDSIKNPYLLSTGLVETSPIYLAVGMDGTSDLNDQTLPELRALVMLKTVTTAKEKRKVNVKHASARYHNANKDKTNSFRKNNYQQLRAYGYDSKESNRMSTWSLDKINKKLMEDLKI